jgi:predicted AlkP superfamily phosphohydrolase/phosphomutase
LSGQAGGARERVLIVGLDVGDGHLIKSWVDEGRLPVLAKLLENGEWSWLETTADMLHVSSWPSLYTGTMPGEHGVYYTFQPAPGRQGWSKFDGQQYGRPTFWNLLSQTGVQCTVFDAPYTHPEPASAATQVIDWGTWAHYWRPVSTPSSVLRELRRQCGDYPLQLEAHQVGLAALDPQLMSQRLAVAAHAKTDAALWLMTARAWDLFFVVYGEPHAGAHYCWSPASTRSQERDTQPGLRVIYEEIDRGIGALLERAGPGASLFIVSGDGVGPNNAGWHLLPEVLRRLGYLVEPAADEQSLESSGREASRPSDPIRRLRDALPKDFRKALARKLPSSLRHRLAQRVDTAAIDWSKTRAFCLPTDLEGCLRINVRGRELHGVVGRGAEYGRVCDEVADALEQLVDPTTGQRAVRDVIRTDQVFPGPRRDHLPDLIVRWNPEAPLRQVVSPAVGTVTGESPDQRPGTHRPPGFLLRYAGNRPADRSPAVHVCDFAPELLRRFGVPVADHMQRRASISRPGLQGDAT